LGVFVILVFVYGNFVNYRFVRILIEAVVIRGSITTKLRPNFNQINCGRDSTQFRDADDEAQEERRKKRLGNGTGSTGSI